jgi:predicted tellurium resistance membrane protein TerC
MVETFLLGWVTDPQAWLALITLAVLEIVLGIDNIIFLSIMVERLPKKQQPLGRFLGLFLAMFMRLALLASIAWLVHLTADLFHLFGQGISGRDLVLFGGGLFLVVKASMEIRDTFHAHSGGHGALTRKVSFGAILFQVVLLDIVFSLDSVITAVGMADHLAVMMLAVILGVVFMMLSAKSIGDFIKRNPTVKMLALAFLVLVGAFLIAESLELHFSKSFIYFAMGFSFVVEILNLQLRKRQQQQ